uniref:Heat shock 70 kDa protein 12A-like n=1 Tax=Cyprinodon variegatus TaxID=28743 RepID=A0A3Q2FYK7_CYPVA
MNNFVIAIDFGTASSGFAFTVTRREEESEPFIKRWGAEEGADTPKTPTCILFDPDQTFMKFGYEAKSAYFKIKKQEAKNYYFFEDFKMDLYGKEITKDLKIKAANNKEITALKVFSESLRFLKDDALKTIRSNTGGMEFSASDFIWVLTVPAIWDESAKQFMRKAAIQAGIVTEETKDKLVIALEPEVASVWSKKLPSNGFITQNQSRDSLDQTPGTQYIVVDCGGGTIDITVHRILKEGALKELHKASGNNLGGQTVDRKFKEFLREIFCDGVWEEYEENYQSEVQKILYDFTFVKRVDGEIQIRCPYNLIKLARKKKDIERFFESVDGVFWCDGSIRISREKLRSFFDESLLGISMRLREILNKDLSFDYILLVGGYAESQILRQHINEEFGEDYKILCPFRPQEVILRGAIEFGRNPKMVTSRKSRFTYGVAVLKRFDESTHKLEKKHTAGGNDWCKDIFKILVHEGEDLGWDETREHVLRAVDSNQTGMSVRLFMTERKDPQYVDDWGVEEVGSFIVELSDLNSSRERKVKLKVKFGSTEITATGTDMTTGEEHTVKFNFKT